MLSCAQGLSNWALMRWINCCSRQETCSSSRRNWEQERRPNHSSNLNSSRHSRAHHRVSLKQQKEEKLVATKDAIKARINRNCDFPGRRSRDLAWNSRRIAELHRHHSAATKKALAKATRTRSPTRKTLVFTCQRQRLRPNKAQQRAFWRPRVVSRVMPRSRTPRLPLSKISSTNACFQTSMTGPVAGTAAAN